MRRPTSFATGLAAALAAFALAPLPAAAPSPPVGTEHMGTGPYAHMEGKLEKTLLQVDVFRARLRFGTEAAEDLEALAAGEELDEALESRIANTAHQARHAILRVRFLRDVDFDTFIDAARTNARKARDADMISSETYRHVRDSLPRWFAFLKDDGIHEGDRLIYRARPESLRTLYVDEAGTERLDQTDDGAEASRAALAGYFAPGVDIREPLIRSLFD